MIEDARSVSMNSSADEQDETGMLARLDFSRLKLQIVTTQIGL